MAGHDGLGRPHVAGTNAAARVVRPMISQEEPRCGRLLPEEEESFTLFL